MNLSLGVLISLTYVCVMILIMSVCVDLCVFFFFFFYVGCPVFLSYVCVTIFDYV